MIPAPIETGNLIQPGKDANDHENKMRRELANAFELKQQDVIPVVESKPDLGEGEEPSKLGEIGQLVQAHNPLDKTTARTTGSGWINKIWRRKDENSQEELKKAA